MSRLNLPSIKLQIQHFVGCERVSREPYNVWKGEVFGKELSYTCVWLQGTILQEQNGMILLDDDTGTAKVNCATAKPPPTNLAAGNYMMVIGELLDNSTVPQVKATKVQNLSSEAKTIWPLEVEDLHRHGLQ